jgi:prepilin-type processing-associated H-X9-DG protein
MRQYGTAHQIYVTDYDVMPGLGEGEGSAEPNSPAWVSETGVFDSPDLGIDLDEAVMKIMNQFPDKYLKDPKVTTCPADPLVRHSEVGTAINQRVGNFLTPDEDERAVGTCMTRVWWNIPPGAIGEPPPDYVVKKGRVFATIGGLTESQMLTFLRPGRLTLPSQSADAVEEDEDSNMNNSVFVPQDNAAPSYPPVPGQYNLIADNHPANSGNIVYHDGHVSNIPNMHQTYWVEEDYETRVEIIWWPYYKDNDDQP